MEHYWGKLINCFSRTCSVGLIRANLIRRAKEHEASARSRVFKKTEYVNDRGSSIDRAAVPGSASAAMTRAGPPAPNRNGPAPAAVQDSTGSKAPPSLARSPHPSSIRTTISRARAASKSVSTPNSGACDPLPSSRAPRRSAAAAEAQTLTASKMDPRRRGGDPRQRGNMQQQAPAYGVQDGGYGAPPRGGPGPSHGFQQGGDPRHRGGAERDARRPPDPRRRDDARDPRGGPRDPRARGRGPPGQQGPPQGLPQVMDHSSHAPHASHAPPPPRHDMRPPDAPVRNGAGAVSGPPVEDEVGPSIRQRPLFCVVCASNNVSYGFGFQLTGRTARWRRTRCLRESTHTRC